MACRRSEQHSLLQTQGLSLVSKFMSLAQEWAERRVPSERVAEATWQIDRIRGGKDLAHVECDDLGMGQNLAYLFRD